MKYGFRGWKKPLYEGHGFSRAVNFSTMRGFSR
jgi:hypothetical protein